MNTVAKISAFNHFKWLLKREFWENRGGFFWAPIIAGSIVSGLFTLLAIIGSSQNKEKLAISIQSNNATHNIDQLLGNFGDSILLFGVLLTCVVLAFVVFFYALGSLYDDRRDRSILFWKSLPVSDLSVVLSKAVWALVLAPIFAVGIGLVIGLVLWVVSAFTLSVNGLPASTALFTHSHPLQIIGNILSIIPVYTLWALPSVGWLMLCSVWVRSKPFLWAVLLPVIACIIISMLGILPTLNISHNSVWYTIAYRGLFSVAPGSWLPVLSDQFASPTFSHPENLPFVLGSISNWQMLRTADLWIGAAIGSIFIAAAIYLRRWRELTD